MEVNKAVITCAGPSQRSLPLQTLVDREGRTTTALGILIGEAVSGGIDQIGVVIHPGDQSAYAEAAGEHCNRITFIEQADPRGYGHAIHSAAGFLGGESFLLMVGDHLCVSRSEMSCARQLIDCARQEDVCVSGVQATHESKLPVYGTVGGKLAGQHQGLYEVDQVIEKPTPTQAEQELIVPGLRAGHYLCFFGMHVLTPPVIELLGQQLKDSASAGLSDVLKKLSGRERYLAHELAGNRYDIGSKYGLLNAQLALALSGRDRAEVLTLMVDLLAHQQSA